MKPEYVRPVTTRVHVRSVTGQLGRASSGGGGAGGADAGAAAPAVAAAGEGENQREVRGKSRKQAKKVGRAAA